MPKGKSGRKKRGNGIKFSNKKATAKNEKRKAGKSYKREKSVA